MLLMTLGDYVDIEMASGIGLKRPTRIQTFRMHLLVGSNTLLCSVAALWW